MSVCDVPASAEIALYRARVTQLRLVGVAPGLAERTAPAHQVPQSVELEAGLPEARAVGGQRSRVAVLGGALLVGAQSPLLVLELLDAGVHLGVVHLRHLVSRAWSARLYAAERGAWRGCHRCSVQASPSQKRRAPVPSGSGCQPGPSASGSARPDGGPASSNWARTERSRGFGGMSTSSGARWRSARSPRARPTTAPASMPRSGTTVGYVGSEADAATGRLAIRPTTMPASAAPATGSLRRGGRGADCFDIACAG